MKESYTMHDNRKWEVVSHFGGWLRLRAPTFASGNGSLRRFLQGALSIEEVQAVTINPLCSSALIRYDGGSRQGRRILRTLSGSTGPRAPRPTFPSYLLPLGWISGKATFGRSRGAVTAWQVLDSLPGRLRLAHPFLRQSPQYCGSAQKALLRLPEVRSAKATVLTGTVLVLYDPPLSVERILTVLEEEMESIAGQPAEPAGEGKDQALVTSSLAFATAGVAQFWMPWAIPFSTALTFSAGYPIFKDACHALVVKRKIKVDILDAIVVMSCLATGQHAIGAFMVWILDVAGALLDKTSSTSRKLLSELFGKKPRFATVLSDGKETKVPLDDVKRGDMVMVYTSEQIPVDGAVVRGDAMVDQHILTGESAPVEKQKGDRAFASTVVLAGKVLIEVEDTADNTSAAKIERIITESATHQTKVQTFGERAADKMVVPTLGLAACGLASGGSSAALAIINADYGTGIRVAAPMAMLACLARAAKHGVVVKKGSALEKLSYVDTFIFDKTGTLTRELPEVASVMSCRKGIDEDTVLWYCAAAEQRFSHPIAKAILDRATELTRPLPPRDALRYHVGFGIEVELEGDVIKVGSARFMRREGTGIPGHVTNYADRARRKGGTVVLVSRNDSLVGAVELEAGHRPEAFDLIQRLQGKGGKDVVLLSGDNEQVTKAVAGQLGIRKFEAEMLPQDKAHFVKELQEDGHSVAMTGDGINDGIALSWADVSISLRGGSDVATDTADVVFMDGDLTKFDLLLDIADMLNKNVRKSFLMLAVSNTACILGALVGMVGLSTSLVLNNGINFAAVTYGMAPFFAPMEGCQAGDPTGGR